jgi:hypothetical protein
MTVKDARDFTCVTKKGGGTMAIRRERPKKVKAEQKQVHFEMDMTDYIEFEKKVYALGYTVSEYFRLKAKEVLENV